MSRVNFSAGVKPAPAEMRRKKKKGETAVEPQINPRVNVPQLNSFASPNFKKFHGAWASLAPCATPPTSWSVSCVSSRNREDRDRSTSGKEALSPPPVL